MIFELISKIHSEAIDRVDLSDIGIQGADFFLEQYLENDVIQIDGRAYGIEFSLKKPSGRINGWLNYTWAKSLLKSNGNSISETINSNQWYDSEFDRCMPFQVEIFEQKPDHVLDKKDHLLELRVLLLRQNQCHVK